MSPVLQDKVVVLIGGAGLLGRAFTRAVAREGAVTVVADLDAARAAAARDAILEAAPGGRIGVETVDITDAASLDAMIARVQALHGRIDGVVNGAYPRNKQYGRKLEDVTYADFCENVNLHLGGYFLAMQRFALAFARQGHGSVVNISSIYGSVTPRFDVYDGTPMTMPVEYAACKSALEHLSTYFMRYYKGTPLRFNCVSPGGILDGQPEAFVARYRNYSQSKGMLDPEDICGALVFLLSDHARYVNGQNLIVDDGWGGLTRAPAMIHFLVNNDYQLVDARRHLASLAAQGEVATLIEVPHALNAAGRAEGFAAVTTFESPLTSRGWMASWPRYFASANEVRRRLSPAPGDVLFFYTEFELLNHFIVRRFKSAGARTVLLEDGGFGTYLPFSIQAREALGTKERLIAAMTRLLPGLGDTAFHKVNDQVFPWLPDPLIDVVAMYRDVRIVRAIPTALMQDVERTRIATRPGKVVFMNERMYDVYQTREQYLDGLARILDALVAGFPSVSFKFHPREQEVWTAPIRQMMASRHPTIRIIEERQSMEALLASEQPEVLASYFSTTLLNLGDCGIQPLYLYHLFEELAAQKIFRQTTTLLNQWHYRFVESFADVRSGYRSGLEPAGRARARPSASLRPAPPEVTMRSGRQLANAAIYLGFSIGGSALGFASVLVLTRLLPPQEYGRIGLFFSILYFVTPLVSLSCDGLIAVKKTTLALQDYQRFQQTCVGLGLACCLAAEAVMLGLWATHVLKDALLVLAPFFALIRLLTSMAGTEYIAEQRALTYGALTMSNSALSLALTVMLSEWGIGSASGRVLAMLAADIALLLVRYWGRLDVLLKPRLRSDFTRQILQFGIPSAIAVAGGWGLNEADKVIVASTRGLSATGLYTAAAALAGIMMTFNQSLTNALYPGLFRVLGTGERTTRWVLTHYVLTFTGLAAVFAAFSTGAYMLFAHRILPPRYVEASDLFVALMLAGVAVAFYRPFGLVADFRQLARLRAIAVSAGGLTAIAIGYVGTRDGSLLWAPAGIAIGYFTASVVLMVGIKIVGVVR